MVVNNRAEAGNMRTAVHPAKTSPGSWGAFCRCWRACRCAGVRKPQRPGRGRLHCHLPTQDAGARTAAGRCRRVRDYESVATCVRRVSRQQHSRPSVRCRFSETNLIQVASKSCGAWRAWPDAGRVWPRPSREAAHFGLVRRWLGLMSSPVCRGLTVCGDEPA
jgi:hypothetical protein